jgi:hypothetical protein
MARDWSAVCANLETSLLDQAGPLLDMGVVGCAGLLRGVVGKPPQPAAAAAEFAGPPLPQAAEFAGPPPPLTAKTTPPEGLGSMSRELEEKAQRLAELKREVAEREAAAVKEATISQKC